MHTGIENLTELYTMAAESYATVIIVGAGSYSGIIPDDSRQWHLLEANPELFQQLQIRYRRQANIKLHPVLPLDRDRQVDYLHYSLPEYNSTEPATGLLQLYPGLQKTGSSLQSARDIAGLITDWQLNVQCDPSVQTLENSRYVALILQPSANTPVLLRRLIETGLLQIFGCIQCWQPVAPLYRNSLSRSDLELLLQQSGYLLIHQQQDQINPDHTLLSFIPNPLYSSLTQLERKVIQLERDKVSLQQTNVSLQEQVQQSEKNYQNLQQNNEYLQAEQKQSIACHQELQRQYKKIQCEYAKLQQQQELVVQELNKAEAQFQRLSSMLFNGASE